MSIWLAKKKKKLLVLHLQLGYNVPSSILLVFYCNSLQLLGNCSYYVLMKLVRQTQKNSSKCVHRYF